MSTLPAVDLRAVMEGHVLRAAHTTLRATGTQCSILRYSIYGIACTLQKRPAGLYIGIMEYQYLAYTIIIKLPFMDHACIPSTEKRPKYINRNVVRQDP